jgi:predicted RNA-binding Zn-ribbon protein involved in translation (DUF1610 family)
MAGVDQTEPGPKFKCPHCTAWLSACWHELDQAVECPLCRQPFQPPTPMSSVPTSAGPQLGRSFQFQCLRCGSVLEASSSQSGLNGKCPSCGALFLVPAMDERTGLAVGNADPGDDGELPAPVHAYAAAGQYAPRIVREVDDATVIECPRCGKHSSITADNCRTCGLPFTLDGVAWRSPTAAGGLAQMAAAIGVLAIPASLCGGLVGIILGVTAILMGIYAVQPRAAKGWGSAAEWAVMLGLIACGMGAALLLL